MFMGTSILARTGARADRPKDFDVAADRLLAYASRLQRADGLFNHASDAPVTVGTAAMDSRRWGWWKR